MENRPKRKLKLQRIPLKQLGVKVHGGEGGDGDPQGIDMTRTKGCPRDTQITQCDSRDWGCSATWILFGCTLGGNTCKTIICVTV